MLCYEIFCVRKYTANFHALPTYKNNPKIEEANYINIEQFYLIMKVVIVHGSNENEAEAHKGGRENTRHFLPWLKSSLDAKGISASLDLYPQDWNPVYEEYKAVFERNQINEETVLVGHSAGCGFILKWLHETKKRVKKVILVAPYVLGIPEASFLDDITISALDVALKEYFDNLIIFVSKDDEKCIVRDAEYVHEQLGGRFMMFTDRGHFTLEDMGTEEFPELLDAVLHDL